VSPAAIGGGTPAADVYDDPSAPPTVEPPSWRGARHLAPNGKSPVLHTGTVHLLPVGLPSDFMKATPPMKLEDLRPNAAVSGILPDTLDTLVSTQCFRSEALELTYKTPAGVVVNELLSCHDERSWSAELLARAGEPS
jgi:hypothetical protein